MKAQPLMSSIMLVGLTRGLWRAAPVDRRMEQRGTLADAARWRSALQSDAAMPGISRVPSHCRWWKKRG